MVQYIAWDETPPSTQVSHISQHKKYLCNYHIVVFLWSESLCPNWICLRSLFAFLGTKSTCHFISLTGRNILDWNRYCRKSILSSRFNGKFDFAWEFQFRMFVKGNEMWSYIDLTQPNPVRAKQNCSVGSTWWNISSVGFWVQLNHLSPIQTTKEKWAYLRRGYNQENWPKVSTWMRNCII